MNTFNQNYNIFQCLIIMLYNNLILKMFKKPLKKSKKVKPTPWTDSMIKYSTAVFNNFKK